MKRRVENGDEESSKNSSKRKASSSPSFWSLIFKHADAVDKCLMVLGFLGCLGDGMSTPIVFAMNSKVFNNLGAGPSAWSSTSDFTKSINEKVIILLYVALGSFVLCFLEGYCWMRTAERQASRMRARYLRAVLRQDVEYFDLNITSSSDVTTGVSSDSLIIQDVFSEKMPNFLRSVSVFVSCYIVSFLLLWKLTLVVFPTVLLLIIPGIMYGWRLAQIARETRDEYSKAGAIIEQAMSSIKTVYSFAAETNMSAKFSAALENSVRLGIRQGLAKGIALGSNGIIFSIWALVMWYGSRLVMYHGAEGGTIYYVGLMIMFGGRELGTGLADLKYFSEASSAAERVNEAINRTPKIDSESTQGEILEKVLGNVEFRAVGFSYPSRPENLVLKDFHLKVPAGKTVALVGSSGSGKSTVIALLQRFYDPQGGEILLDGMDIRKLNLKWLRSQMGLVSQEPALFGISIKENILFGKEDATMDEVIAAAKAANAHNFVCQLPQAYETLVGERGMQLSGGQKQRIAIARAILRSPKIFLLDEATSALDTESERVVQEAIDFASVGRTTIVIAHRLSTIKHADVIAVAQAGQVLELGSHDELISNEQGIYSSLVHLQQMTKGNEEINLMTPCDTSHEFETIIHANSNSSLAETMEREDAKQIKFKATTFRRFLTLITQERKKALLGILGSIGFGAIQPAYAFCSGSMISIFFLHDHDEIKSKTRTYVLVLASFTVLSFLFSVIQHYNFGAVGELVSKRVRERIFSKILTFEVGWFDQEDNSTGSICARLANDANSVRSLVGDRMSLICQAISAVLIAYVMALVISWKLALVIIVTQPIAVFCCYIRLVLLKRMSSKVIKALSQSSKLTGEALSDFRTITAFSLQSCIIRLFKAAQEGPLCESIRQSWYVGIGLAFSRCFLTCSLALYFWYAGKLLADSSISAKSFYQTIIIFLSTGFVIAQAGSTTSDIAKGADAIASVFKVLDRSTRIQPDDPNSISCHPDHKLIGNIEIQEVEFAYPTRPSVIVLRDFTLNIEARKSTALVGQSGSGKSTIISLLERFYDPLKGNIRIDGKDIKSYNLRSLRKHIGLVGQEPTLFIGTIRENIIYGNEGSTEQEVIAAAVAANAHDFISSLKDGYGTQCGHRGLQLSGGQKQRIAIARAILKNPAILLLDEATSALDSQSERVVQETLEKVMVDRTSVVVAHRLSTIQNCDLIAVMEKGIVMEKGTHTSLLAKGPTGLYHKMVNLQ